MSQKNETEQYLLQNFTNKEKELCEKFCELVKRLGNSKTGILYKTEKDLGTVIGIMHHADISNLKNLCDKISKGEIKNRKEGFERYKNAKSKFDELSKFVAQLEKLNEAPISPPKVIEKQFETFSSSIEHLRNEVLTSRKIYITLSALILLLLIFTRQCSKIPQNDTTSSSPLAHAYIPADTITETPTGKNKMRFTDFGDYPMYINMKCKALEEDLSAAILDFDNLLKVQNKSISTIDKEMQALKKLLNDAGEQKCDGYFTDDIYNDVFYALFLGYYVSDQEAGLQRLYKDYLSKNFKRKEKTEKELKALMSYKKFNDSELPIDDAIPVITNILNNMSDDLEKNLSIIEGRSVKVFLTQKLETLKSEYTAIKKQQEEERKRKLAEEKEREKQQQILERDSIKKNLKIWVFDTPSTKVMRPKNIVAVLRKKGFESVEYKGQTKKGEWKNGYGYFSPKMEGEKYSDFLKQIKKTTATGTYLLWEGAYGDYRNAKSPFIMDKNIGMKKHFENGDVDIILVF